MKSVIVGAGAIGAYLAARMTRAGLDAALIARAATYRAIAAHGVRVRAPEEDFEARVPVFERFEDGAGADTVFLAVKAHSLPGIAPRLKPLLGPATTVVSMQNGIPWWYFDGPERLERVDPGGRIAAAIDSRSVLGSIVYFSTMAVEPGVIQHIEGNRITLGEPGGERSERARRISELLIRAGLRAPVTTHLRQEIWVKLLGNVAFNPISALTGATLAQMVRDPEVALVVRRIMAEVEAVAKQLGLKLPVTIEQRMAGAEKVGGHKTSMLQDLEAGRPLELEAIAGAALELGERLGVAMPYTRAVYACTRLRAAHSVPRESVVQSG